MDEDEYQQAINDNLDFDDLDLEDEGEINYDYSDVSDFDVWIKIIRLFNYSFVWCFHLFNQLRRIKDLSLI